MSGGVAYVLDEDGRFTSRCNTGIVDLDLSRTRRRAAGARRGAPERTGSPVAAGVLADWDVRSRAFVKVMPRDFKRRAALARRGSGARRYPTSTRPSGAEGFVTAEVEAAAEAAA